MKKAFYEGETDLYLTNLGKYDVESISGETVYLKVSPNAVVAVHRNRCTIFEESETKATPLKVSMENMPKMTHEEAVEEMNKQPIMMMPHISFGEEVWKSGGISLKNADIVSGTLPLFEDGEKGDSRYNVPKEKPKFSQEEIDAVIAENEIYRRTRSEIERSLQREQVGYGMGKYPEPLTADTWTILETIGHIKGEIMDTLHYLTMLEIKFEKMGDK